jgi:hypothetical protein
VADHEATQWLFDVDGTLIDSLSGTTLRPGAAELLERVRATGATVILWSAGGAEYARARAASLGIEHLVDEFHDKDGRDADGRYLLPPTVALAGATFVDDRPEDMPIGATVVAVSPYLSGNTHDRALARVLEQL